MSPRSLLLWSLAAVAGLLLAAGITLAASELSSQNIGLSSEPLSAGDRLAAPAAQSPAAQAGRGSGTAAADGATRGQSQSGGGAGASGGTTGSGTGGTTSGSGS